LLTAPPLRLPGAIGSPAAPVATVWKLVFICIFVVVNSSIDNIFDLNLAKNLLININIYQLHPIT
jgi:hypothetical protein